jgi:hypothetical protein
MMGVLGVPFFLSKRERRFASLEFRYHIMRHKRYAHSASLNFFIE